MYFCVCMCNWPCCWQPFVSLGLGPLVDDSSPQGWKPPAGNLNTLPLPLPSVALSPCAALKNCNVFGCLLISVLWCLFLSAASLWEVFSSSWSTERAEVPICVWSLLELLKMPRVGVRNKTEGQRCGKGHGHSGTLVVTFWKCYMYPEESSILFIHPNNHFCLHSLLKMLSLASVSAVSLYKGENNTYNLMGVLLELVNIFIVLWRWKVQYKYLFMG